MFIYAHAFVIAFCECVHVCMCQILCICMPLSMQGIPHLPTRHPVICNTPSPLIYLYNVSPLTINLAPCSIQSTLDPNPFHPSQQTPKHLLPQPSPPYPSQLLHPMPGPALHRSSADALHPLPFTRPSHPKPPTPPSAPPPPQHPSQQRVPPPPSTSFLESPSPHPPPPASSSSP